MKDQRIKEQLIKAGLLLPKVTKSVQSRRHIRAVEKAAKERGQIAILRIFKNGSKAVDCY